MDSSDIITDNGSDNGDPTPPVPVTPQSKKRAAKHGENGITSDESPTKKTKTAKAPAVPTTNKERKEPAVIRPGRGIPRTLEEASEADKMLLQMKREDRPWAEINEAWEALTGQKPGKSTLCVRLARLKANLAAFTPEDNEKILAIKKALEEQFEREKWGKIASALEEQGGSDKFTAMQIQKHVKELEKKAAVTETNGLTTV